jgi:periplasmic protein TonB
MTLSRIRCPRVSDPRAITAESHRNSHLIAFADPVYPDAAKAQGIEGKVVVDVRIDRDGQIETLSVRSGDPLLAEAALQAIRTWTYRPTTVNGTPVGVDTDVEVTFTLPDRVASA